MVFDWLLVACNVARGDIGRNRKSKNGGPLASFLPRRNSKAPSTPRVAQATACTPHVFNAENIMAFSFPKDDNIVMLFCFAATLCPLGAEVDNWTAATSPESDYPRSEFAHPDA